MTKTRIEALEFFAQRQNTSLSYSFIICSGVPGPKIVIMGGVHGNEPVGVDAIIEIQKDLTGLKRGEVTFILGNPQAYLQDIRFISSNLNRCFIANFPNDYEGYRAKEITKFLKQYKPEYLLDLHSVSIGDTKMEIHKNLKSVNKELLNPDFMQIVLTEKATRGSTIQLKFIPKSMGVECGNHTSKKGLNVGIFKIKELLNVYKMTDFNLDKLRNNINLFAYELSEPIIPEVNFSFVDPDITSEIFVKKGDIYAKSDKGDIVALEDRYILMPCKNPKISDTDAGFLAKKVIIL